MYHASAPAWTKTPLFVELSVLKQQVVVLTDDNVAAPRSDATVTPRPRRIMAPRACSATAHPGYGERPSLADFSQ